MGCQADYTEEDLRLMKSVREQVKKEIISLFKEDSIYTGAVIKFEINNLK